MFPLFRRPSQYRQRSPTVDDYPRESDGICFHRRWFVCVSVCLSVTTICKKIVDGFVTNFMGRFLGGKGRPSSCFVTIGRGKPAIVYKNQRLFTKLLRRESRNYRAAKYRCGKCCQALATKTLSRGFVLSQSTFHLVYL